MSERLSFNGEEKLSLRELTEQTNETLEKMREIILEAEGNPDEAQEKRLQELKEHLGELRQKHKGL